MLLVFKSHNHFLNYFQDFLSKLIKCNFNWEMHFQLKKKREKDFDFDHDEIKYLSF